MESIEGRYLAAPSLLLRGENLEVTRGPTPEGGCPHMSWGGQGLRPAFWRDGEGSWGELRPRRGPG